MSAIAHLTAAILAGGLGTRLQSVVSDRHKGVAEINGRPFLAYLLDQLAAAGIKRVVLCTGYMADTIKAQFGSDHGQMQLIYSEEKSPLGTGGALRLAAPYFESPFVLVMNGDSYCDVDLAHLWMWHQQQDAQASIVLTRVADTSRYGAVKLEEERVQKFEEKGNTTGAGWINAGIYLIKSTLIDALPAGQKISLEKEVFPRWIEMGLHGFKSDGAFIDIGTPESYAQAQKFFAE